MGMPQREMKRLTAALQCLANIETDKKEEALVILALATDLVERCWLPTSEARACASLIQLRRPTEATPDERRETPEISSEPFRPLAYRA